MRLRQKSAGEQGNFPLIAGHRAGALPAAGNGSKGVEIGKLLISHFHRFLQDFLPRGVGQTVCIVDGLGDRVARDAKRIRNVLYRNFFHEKTSLLFYIQILS